jgi:hypothetical protein
MFPNPDAGVMWLSKPCSKQNSCPLSALTNGIFSGALVVHTCNPSYSGGRDQEDQGLKPAQANSLREQIAWETVYSEDLGPCVPVWNSPGRTCGCKWGLLKVRKGNTKGAWWAQVESISREQCFSFSDAFKIYTNPWQGQTQEIPTQ